MPIMGVDQSIYPGQEVMNWLRANGGFRVTGFYLGPAPQHRDQSWMGARSALAQSGWGLLPTYVGRQSDDAELGAAAGTVDATDAAALMKSAGFPDGGIVYLDIETGGPIAPDFEAYIDGWIAGVKTSTFTPAIYCSHLLAAFALAKTAVVWTFHLPAGTEGQTYDPAKLPRGMIDAGAVATQYRQNILLAGGGEAKLDLNSCKVADPSNLATVNHHLGRA